MKIIKVLEILKSDYLPTYPVDWVAVVLSIGCEKDVEDKYNSKTNIVRHHCDDWAKLSIVNNEHPAANLKNKFHEFFKFLNLENLESISILETASTANFRVRITRLRPDKAPFFSVFLKNIVLIVLYNSHDI